MGTVGGVDGNERLTAATGAVLLVLFAALGVTILSIGQLIWWHVLLGMLLIPPVVLKLGSTGWRFLRYYTGRREYVLRGPPLLLLRLLAPLVVASTIAVFATGVALLAIGPSHGFVVLLHKASFVVWLGATGIHVLAHLRRLPSLTSADWRGRSLPPESAVSGTLARRLLVAGAVVAGAVLAVATVRYAQPRCTGWAGSSRPLAQARTDSSWAYSGRRSRSPPSARSSGRSGTTTRIVPPRRKPIRSGPASSGS
jgi:hypothetical protein